MMNLQILLSYLVEFTKILKHFESQILLWEVGKQTPSLPTKGRLFQPRCVPVTLAKRESSLGTERKDEPMSAGCGSSATCKTEPEGHLRQTKVTFLTVLGLAMMKETCGGPAGPCHRWSGPWQQREESVFNQWRATGKANLSRQLHASGEKKREGPERNQRC